MSLTEQLTKIHQDITAYVADKAMLDLAYYLGRHADHSTDIQALKIMLVAAKLVKEDIYVAASYYCVKKVFDEKEADLKAIAEGREPVKRPTDLEHMRLLMAGKSHVTESVRGDETLMHIGTEGCFVYDKDGKEIDMDF